jgi:hypothetical protein
MARATTMMPAQLRAAPCDLVAFDRWQDREGLVDASEALGSAWAAFRPRWRMDRDRELKRPVDPVSVPLAHGLTRYEQSLAAVARRLGRATGYAPSLRSPRLTALDRRTWEGWRLEALRTDQLGWSLLWRLLGHDDPLGLVAYAAGLSVEVTLARTRRVLGLLAGHLALRIKKRVKNQSLSENGTGEIDALVD